MQTKINFELIEFLETCFSILIVLRILYPNYNYDNYEKR
mgnify:CR=1 FL=1